MKEQPNELLLASARAGNLDLTKEAFRRGADSGIVDDRGSSLFWSVLLGDDARLVELFLENGASPHVISGHKDNPIHVAAFCGNIEIVQLLLTNGADINDLSEYDVSGLGIAASMESARHFDLMVFLISQGADLNHPGGWESPLNQACEARLDRSVKLLLESGAKVNVDSLVSGMEEFSPSILGMLLDYGGDPTWRVYADPDKNPIDLSVIEYAEQFECSDALKFLAQYKPNPAGTSTPPIPRTYSVVQIRKSWQRIHHWIKENHDKPELRRGATSEQLDKLSQRIGRQLSAEFKASYAVVNGQKGAVGFVDMERDGRFSLLSLEDVFRMYKRFLDDVDEELYADLEATSSIGVRVVWWDEGWIPFASNGGGDFLCLDLRPGPEGRKGQVISYFHDSPKREILAPSFGAWLEGIAGKLD